METISQEQIHSYFSIRNANKTKDMNRLQDGNYSNYYTQIEFMHFLAGFNCCLSHFKGDNK